MTVSGWRIVKSKHASTAFTGYGAKTYGGRWNSPGFPVVYCAGTASLAMLEMLVHLAAPDVLKRYVLFEAAFDDSLIEIVDPKSLPKNWRRSPAPPSLQALGDDWLAASRSVVLRVPSAIVPAESNYLLNPAHADFARVTVGPKRPVKFDPRLVKT